MSKDYEDLFDALIEEFEARDERVSEQLVDLKAQVDAKVEELREELFDVQESLDTWECDEPHLNAHNSCSASRLHWKVKQYEPGLQIVGVRDGLALIGSEMVVERVVKELLA